MAVVVRHPDGSFTCNHEPFPAVANVLGCAAVTAVGIGDDFVREVEGLMQPGTSALFVVDSEGNMEVILHAIQGLGGTVLRTNVDLQRAKLIQSTLAAASADTSKPDGQ